jgi:thioredoxin 1
MLILENNSFKNEVSQGLVFVDFHSIGCGPCRMMEPTLKALDEKMKNIKFAKIEASDGEDVFIAYGISHVPTFVLFKEGKEVGRRSGLMSMDDTEKWINERLL